MFRPLTACSLIVLCSAFSLVWCEPNPQEAAARPRPVTAPPAALANPQEVRKEPKIEGFQQMAHKLSLPISMEGGIDANTPLNDALEFLSQRYEVPILVNTAAFKKAGTEDVETLPVKLPKILGARLGTVLQMLLNQVNAAYLVRSDHIEVTTLQDSRPEVWPGNQSARGRALMPLVSVAFEKRPLTDALKELSTLTDVSVVVDGRAGEKKGNTAVTATFKNVPLDTAVRVLADIAGLSSMLIDNVLYVTTRPNAKVLEAEQAKRRGE